MWNPFKRRETKTKLTYGKLLKGTEIAYNKVRDDIRKYERDKRRAETRVENLEKEKTAKYMEMEREAKNPRSNKNALKAIFAGMALTEKQQENYEMKKQDAYCKVQKLGPIEFELKSAKTDLKRYLQERKIYGKKPNISMRSVINILKRANKVTETSSVEFDKISPYIQDRFDESVENFENVLSDENIDVDTMMETWDSKAHDNVLNRAYQLMNEVEKEDDSKSSGYNLSRAKE